MTDVIQNVVEISANVGSENRTKFWSAKVYSAKDLKKKGIIPSNCTLIKTLGQEMLIDLYNFVNGIQEDAMQIQIC